MDESSLGVHEVELVVESGPSLSDGSRVGEHAHGARHLREVSARHHGRGLVVDSNLQRRPFIISIGMEGGQTLNPVGHQSTNWMVLLVLMAAMAELTSFGTTSPRYSRHTAMYLPCLGSHFTCKLERD